jgi:hypothetical protein
MNDQECRLEAPTGLETRCWKRWQKSRVLVGGGFALLEAEQMGGAILIAVR